MNIVMVSKNLSAKNISRGNKKLFPGKTRKPLINHQLSQKLKAHSLYSGDQPLKKIEIDLGSDSDEKEHDNDRDESLEEMNKCINVVTRYMNSDETALVSATKNLNPAEENSLLMNTSAFSGDCPSKIEKAQANFESLSTVPVNTSHHT